MNSPSLLKQLQDGIYPAFTVGHIGSQAQHTRFDRILKKKQLSDYQEELSLASIQTIVDNMGAFAFDLGIYYRKNFEAFTKSHPEFVIAIDGLYSTIKSFRQIPDTIPKRSFFGRKNNQPIQEFYTEQKPVYFWQIEDGPDDRRDKQVAIIGHFVTQQGLFDTTKNISLDKNARGGVYQFNGVFVPIDELNEFIEIIKADPLEAHQISAYAFERLPKEVRNRAVKINGEALVEAQSAKGATLALAQLKQDDIRGLSTDGGLKLPTIAEIAYHKN